MICKLVLALSIPLFAQQSNPVYPQALTEEQGLPQAYVSDIMQGPNGFIWMATLDGLCRYDGRRFRVFQPTTDTKTSISFSAPLALEKNSKGRIWIRNAHNELDLFDPVQETFINFSRQPFYRQQFSKDTLDYIYADRRNKLWAYFRKQGLVAIDLRTNQIQSFVHQAGDDRSIRRGKVNGIVEDKDNNLWLATSTGLDHFDWKTNRFSHYQLKQESTPDPTITSLFLRADGQLILLSRNHIIILKPSNGHCRRFALPPEQLSTTGNKTTFFSDPQGHVFLYNGHNLLQIDDHHGPLKLPLLTDNLNYTCFLIDQSNVLWAGTDGKGVRKYDLTANQFCRQSYQSNFHTDLLVNQLGIPRAQIPRLPTANSAYYLRYAVDQQHRLFLNVGKDPLYQVDLKTKQLTTIPFPISFNSVRDDRPVPLAIDPDGTLWASCQSKLLFYNRQTGTWNSSTLRMPDDKSIVTQFVIDRQAFWFSTYDHGLYRLDRVSGAIRHYTHKINQTTSLNSNIIYCLSADPTDKDILWIGTFGCGLARFNKRTGESQRFTTKNGLPNNVIYSALPDQQGYLWIGTNKGLCRLNRRTFETQTFTSEDGLIANEFNRYHFLGLPDNRIILGGLEGITSFNSTHIKPDTFNPTVKLTGIQINNRDIQSSPDLMPAGGSPPVHTMTELALRHDQNYVTVEFAALQFNRMKKNQFRYSMKGLDKGWTVVNQPLAVYTDLKPGQYVLLLNASNSSGLWSKHYSALTITVEPPWWATWWAYSLYGMLVLLILYGLLRSYKNRLQLHQSILLKQNEVELRNKEAKQLEEIDELKTRFFANITHDFKTPLTLILAPAQYLRNELKQTKYIRQISSIEHNAHQLLRLINQLMDLSKVDAKAMQVHETYGNPGALIGQIINSFDELAEQKRITLTYLNKAENNYMFDSMLLERIVYNLLSNAIKFTPPNGHVTVHLTASDGMTLLVADTGLGIPRAQLDSIFDRFVQVDSSTAQSYEGTGIGLSLVKELVDLQRGRIYIESEDDALKGRRGTTVTVQLPYQLIESPQPYPITYIEDGSGQSVVRKADSVLLLLVEDNQEMADVISDCLPDHYTILLARNGQEGLDQAVAQLPDLIISDVLMPIMDGYALCARLKNDTRVNHIPIILLTAKSSVESRLEGLSLGADDYITKPFLLPELQLRVHNLLDRQLRLRNQVRNNLTSIDQEQTTDTQISDDPFLTKIYAILDTRLDNTAYGVEELSQDIGMSRSTLHRKIKMLTTLIPNELIRNYRLKKSITYLQQGYTIAETATLVGFDSPSYFTKCFRHLYGTTPKKMATKNSEY